jgi:hypothetical protein
MAAVGPAEAREIAEEQIAWWIGRGVCPVEAWWALGQRSVPGGWGRVRMYLVRWTIDHANT